ncbi:MAG: hypothetical protein COW24_05270 [Candidatus Kerfeldbacteria bacterium CG15_BIG_FIL_POST_REV_8_21_14_020_45_12]|uniref:Uncharacterized protein n=1 Tax=Candidatus Kerfeldbacteria bacterium CG15_BIG_FIL_POST_REV_8_21_14_020_45_12 TaxID=2014247 RepID=A0A2M7H2H0_9BACT|nr:MAG: hypothetical protein COW24_05270 [Candidatus Kerfeldbacteria bacterium CG15_BIG_FIL_POST_REV_8_21_14_020_45_12]PJA93974.1 MAG: hypothetical protein CO132_00300 [Candidatus Kerfeldbacteria bacterium CG_4_9_14_3_um_filter_45_8]
MGTEILPLFLTLAKILLAVVALFAIFTIIAAALQYRKAGNDEVIKTEMKGHVINSLIAIVITLITYLLLNSIGPIFRVFF